MNETMKDYFEIAKNTIKWAEIEGTMQNYVAGLLKANDEKDKEIKRLNKEVQFHKKMESIAIDCQNDLHGKVERLDDIINELEKWVEYQAQHTMQQHNYYSVLNKIKELKEGE